MSSKEETLDGPKSNSKFSIQKTVLYILCAILFCVSTLVLITFTVIYVPKIYIENYAVVIDAGSTGSRAFLYKWKDSAEDKNDVVTELSSCKADKLQNLDWTNPNNSLVECISSVISDIPSSLLNRPYIYLASTAGMRLYEIKSPKETEVLFNHIKSIFQKKHWRTQYVGIISGKMEGISAWITANVLKNKIGKNITRQETIGAIDLGGSSTQIAYETSSSKDIIDLYSYSYPVYAKSYLCYGTNMFYLKYMSYVAFKAQETSFSCLLRNAPIKIKNDNNVCRYNGTHNFNFTNVVKQVIPDPTNCKRQISAVVNSEMEFRKVPLNAKFVAMSAYNYYYNFLKKYYNAGKNMSDFQRYTNKFCTEDYNTIPTKFTSHQKYAPRYCVIGMYILELFKGYGITNLSNLEFTDKIEGQNVGWNLGYMIDKTRSIPEAYIRKLDTSLFIAMIVVFTVIFVTSIISLLYLVWERHQKVENIDI